MYSIGALIIRDAIKLYSATANSCKGWVTHELSNLRIGNTLVEKQIYIEELLRFLSKHATIQLLIPIRAGQKQALSYSNP